MRPTFHESWYRVAELRPRLRCTVQTTRQHFRGRRWHVVHDPANNRHFRIDEAGAHFLGLLDGRRTVQQAWDLAQERLGDDAPTQGEAIHLLGQLFTSNLLQSDLPADATSMLALHDQRRRRQITGVLGSLLCARIPLFDPDALLDRWERVLGLAFTWPAFVAWWMLLLVAGVILAGRVDELIDGAPSILAPDNLPLLFAGFILVKALHELGHAVSTKRLGRRSGRGGEVHTVGVMIFLLTPMPYVDASSSWSFPSKWHRVLVGVAGMYVELAVAAVAALVWAHTGPGTAHTLAYDLMVVASVSTLLFNGNPLMRFDGYYVFSDLVEAPNLADRARAQLLAIVRRRVFGVRDVLDAATTRGERRWLPVYAIAAAVYRVIVTVGIVSVVADRLFVVGAALAIAAAAGWILVPLARFLRYLFTAPELASTRPRAVLASAACLGALGALLGAVRVPEHRHAEGVLEPLAMASVYAPADGFVVEMRPSGRDVDPAGSPIVRTRSRELEAERDRLRAGRLIAELERDRAALDDVGLARSLEQRLAALDERLADVQRRIDGLDVRAPIAGTWVAPEDDRLHGAFVRQGDPLGFVAGTGRLLVRAVADQRLGPRIEPELGADAAVELRVRGRPDLAFPGRVQAVLPAGFLNLPSAALGYLAGGATVVEHADDSGTTAENPFFEVRIDLDADDVARAGLRSGQRVLVRFRLPPRPLAAQWWRAARQHVLHRFGV